MSVRYCCSEVPKIRQLDTRGDLIALQQELGLRGDWHEPDEQGVTAQVLGFSFDNAMGTDRELVVGHGGVYEAHPRDGRNEMLVVLSVDEKPVAVVNLANLFAWACGGGERG